ncbi:hypothetical protein CRUP_019913, partial [Coryphaenoides rupestris]
MKDSVQRLPQSLSQLVVQGLDRLCFQYRAMQGLRPALGALALSTTGLREADLYGLVNSCGDLPSSGEPVTWERALQLARKPGGRVAMATFTQMVRNLQSLIGLAHSTDDLLTLTNPEVRLAFEDFLLPTETDRVQAHLILPPVAAADPQGTDTFLHCEADHIKHLPAHLGLLGRNTKAPGGVRLMNYARIRLHTASVLVSTFSSEPTCVAMNPCAELVVVGTGQGSLHLIHANTGQEVKSLVSSCDGISSCVFLTDVILATTSFNGLIEIWDTETGCRTAHMEGHSNMITGSDVSPDRKHLATVSLDFQLKVWSASKGHQVASRSSSSPMNCVAFNPDGDLLALGCWDGTVLLWNWLQNRTLM